MLIIISLLNMNSALGSQSSTKEPKPPCRLQISIAHLSTHINERLGIRAVKVDASSICNIPQSDVAITVEIWKKGKLQNHQVRTSYYGVAYSKAFIAGKWQYARHVLSLEIIPLNCGA